MGTRRDGHNGRRNTVRLWSPRNESCIKGGCPSSEPFDLIIFDEQQCIRNKEKQKRGLVGFPLSQSDKNVMVFDANLQNILKLYFQVILDQNLQTCWISFEQK